MIGDELSDIKFLNFRVLKVEEKKEEEKKTEPVEEEEDDDEYGIKDQVQKYVGIRLCPKSKAVINVDQVQASTWLVLVAEENDPDAFKIKGSDTPLWLAYVEDVVIEEGGARTLSLRWWVPAKGTKNFTEDPENSGKISFLKVPGKDGVEDMKVDHKQLVHINIKSLNGLSKKTKAQGKLNKHALKAIANVLCPSEVDKFKAVCPGCKSDCGSDNEEEPTVECVACNQRYHLKCLPCEVTDDAWYCDDCL